MRKTAVVFPGVGYTKDRPLLYYSGKQAVRCGFELIHINFGSIDWSKDKLKDQDFLKQTLERCLRITEETLADKGDISDGEVLFISKSIGTVVATAYARKKGIRAKQICFSPLEHIGDFIGEGAGMLFYGDDDPFADHRPIERIAEEKRLGTYRVAGGNHSLETGDVCKDIDNLKEIILRVADMIN